jgi:uncharacterized protein (DUF1697 family)
MQYLALLRGINVGGKNIVKMADLRETVEAMGFDDVATYIQSGNVLFRASRERSDALADRIETELTDRLGIELRVVLLTDRQLAAIVAGAPPGFGAETHLSDVIFLRKPLTPAKALAAFDQKEGVDSAWAGKSVVYFAREAERASSSRMGKVTARPEYQNMTIRSWKTTMKLLALMEERASNG